MRKIFGICLLIAVVLLSSINSIGSVSAVTYNREEAVIVHMDGGKSANPYNHNPYLAGWFGRCKGHHQLMMEFLFYYNHANGTIMPWLARSAEMSPDYKTCVLTLRQGVKWNDGEDFTAEDVAFTYNMLLASHDPPLAYEIAVQNMIESVEIIDTYTVQFNLKVPEYRFTKENILACMDWGSLAIVPKHIWEDVDPTTYDAQDMVWTGPYKLVEASAAGDRLVWERLDGWWGTEVFGIRPAAKYWIFVWYATPEACALQLIGNNMDYGDLADPGIFLSERESNPSIRAFYLEEPYGKLDPAPFYLPVNNMRYPWNIREARRALSYCLDRDALNTISQGGISPPYPGVFGHYVEPRFKDAMYAKGEEYNVLEYNLDKADQIFSGLGWQKGTDGIWVTDNGTRVTFDMLVMADWLPIKKYGEQMVDQLRDAGIDASAKLLTGTPLWDSWDRGLWDGAAMWIGGDPIEPLGTLTWMTSQYVVPVGEPSIANNIRWSNSTLDAVVDQMRSMSPDDAGYMDLVNQALDIMYQDMPYICTVSDAFINPVNTKYWTNWPTAENFYIFSFPNAYSGSGHFTALELQPADISSTTVYFTNDTQRFRGIDHVWYGPFESRDAARVPVDDAEYWIRMGYASYTQPAPITPTIPTELIEAIAEDVSSLKDSVDTLGQAIEAMPTVDVAGLTTLLYAVIGLQALVLVAVIAVAMLKKS